MGRERGMRGEHELSVSNHMEAELVSEMKRS